MYIDSELAEVVPQGCTDRLLSTPHVCDAHTGAGRVCKISSDFIACTIHSRRVVLQVKLDVNTTACGAVVITFQCEKNDEVYNQFSL